MKTNGNINSILQLVTEILMRVGHERTIEMPLEASIENNFVYSQGGVMLLMLMINRIKLSYN